MTTNNVTPVLELVYASFIERGWRRQQCVRCGKTFFAKPTGRHVSGLCGHGGCASEPPRLLSMPRRKRLVTPQEVLGRMQAFFQATGYINVPSKNIAQSEGVTDLVVAGVQLLDPFIHKGVHLPHSAFFVAQPCVRTQFQEDVPKTEGISTAFVNTCTERINSSAKEHDNSIDQWCEMLSRLGLHMDDMTLVGRVSENNWGTGVFASAEIFFVYADLELGDAAYASVPTTSGENVVVSDIGFGLERVVWAMNKTPSYFDVLAPLVSLGPRELWDLCRTVALLSLCRVKPSNKGAGVQLRRFCKIIAERFYILGLQETLQHFIAYWKYFLHPDVTDKTALLVIQQEIERFINLKVCAAFSGPPPRSETAEAYLTRLVYNHGISVQEARDATASCRP